MPPLFRSDFAVKAVPDGCCGSDRLIALAAWACDPDAVPPEKDDTPAGYARVIAKMIRDGHTSPFEKGKMEVFLCAPGVVWWQLTRHRFMGLDSEDFSFNIESGRYKVLDGVFYEPPDDRPVVEPPGFRPTRPVLAADPALLAGRRPGRRVALADTWAEYERAVAAGVAREVARLDLPNWSLYCSGYVGANPLTWLKFFEKRKAGGSVPTFPQWEIEQVTAACEYLFACRWPAVFTAFTECGRVAP